MHYTTPSSAAASVTTSASEVPSFRESLITEEELNECDKIDLHLLGHIQGDTANVVFVKYNGDDDEDDEQQCTIMAVDVNLVKDLPFVRRQTLNNDTTITEEQSKQQQQPPPNARDLLGAPLRDWFPSNMSDRIDGVIREMVTVHSTRGYSFLAVNGIFYTISVTCHDKNDHSLLSIEIEGVDNETASMSLNSTLLFLGRGMEFHGRGEHAAIAACDIMFDLLSTYDRGMVYRFNDDLSGDVIHEIKRNDSIQPSYVGLRFPASDIPQSARQLYVKNAVRYIRNVDAVDVPVVSLNNETVDMTQTRCRSCHKAHLVYMKNMGVVCSMSIVIVVEGGELWGLLAFHGYRQPGFKPSLHQRVACESIANVVSARVETVLKKAQSARIVKLGQLLMRWKPSGHVRDNLERIGDSVLEILESEVLVGLIENVDTQKTELFVKGDYGLVPSTEFWVKMKAACDGEEMISKSTRKQIADMGLTEEDCPAAGFVYFQEGETQLMIGRAWRGHDVVWGGAADAPKPRINGILNPRTSFEACLEKSK